MPLDNSQELFYQVDENDIEIGSVTRKEAHSNPSIIHRSVALLLINEKNEMLFQKRSMQKDMNPGNWSYGVGGHVNYGSSYDETVKRELKEELGLIEPNIKFLKKILVFTGIETEMKSVFELRLSTTPQINIDRTEVDEVQWVKLDQIPQFINTHPVANWTIEALKQTGFL